MGRRASFTGPPLVRRESNTQGTPHRWPIGQVAEPISHAPLTGRAVRTTLTSHPPIWLSGSANCPLSQSATPPLRGPTTGARMSPELISILVLIVVFVIATTRSVNMGALAFAAAFAVGELVADLDADGIFAGFPGDLFVVLVGVTYLFAIARANGTTDWLVHASIRLVRGRVALIPWVMFAITGALTAIGAVSPAAVAIVAPIALSFAARYGISPLLMGAMVVHGAQGGGFSPISIYGTIVNGIVEREHLPGNEVFLFLASLIVNVVIAGVMFVLFGGLKLWAQGAVPLDEAAGAGGAPDKRDAPDGGAAPAPPPPPRRGPPRARAPPPPPPPPPAPPPATAVATRTEAPDTTRLSPARIATLTALVALVVAVLAFDLDAGLTSITLAVILSAAWPQDSRKA